MTKKVVAIVSGGLDSSTLLYYLLSRNYHVYPIIFSYDQKNRDREFTALRSIYSTLFKRYEANLSAFRHVKLPLFDLVGSALISTNIEIPNSGAAMKVTAVEKDATIVPFRNAIFISIATGYADSIGANEVNFGG